MLMGLSPAATLGDRFADARGVLDSAVARGRRVGRTYQGFVKALRKAGDALVWKVQEQLRQAIGEVARSRHLERFGWFILAVDGSKIDCVRSRANEKAFGIGGRSKSAPQQMLTTLWHMGTGLPWAWVAGRAHESERDHLRQMLELLPRGCLLVADSGFTGFDLLNDLQQRECSFLIRVAGNVTLLRKLGYALEERGDTAYLWPRNRRSHQPLVVRMIKVGTRKKRVFLITNVLSEQKLSQETASQIYRMRWGIEVFYRSLKQTLQRRKMRSAAPRQAELELHWSMIALQLLGLMSVERIIARGKDPLNWSVATSLRIVRRTINTPRSYRTLRRQLATAIKDRYTRRRSKRARNWPHKKNDPPPARPRVCLADASEVRRAQSLRSGQMAA